MGLNKKRSEDILILKTNECGQRIMYNHINILKNMHIISSINKNMYFYKLVNWKYV
jgi:hypothetical protein